MGVEKKPSSFAKLSVLLIPSLFVFKIHSSFDNTMWRELISDKFRFHHEFGKQEFPETTDTNLPTEIS